LKRFSNRRITAVIGKIFPMGRAEATASSPPLPRISFYELSKSSPNCSASRDPGYFNRFFKRLTGIAPGAYRQTIATARSTRRLFAAWP
jgi:hypothetical protein